MDTKQKNLRMFLDYLRKFMKSGALDKLIDEKRQMFYREIERLIKHVLADFDRKVRRKEYMTFKEPLI